MTHYSGFILYYYYCFQYLYLILKNYDEKKMREERLGSIFDLQDMIQKIKIQIFTRIKKTGENKIIIND